MNCKGYRRKQLWSNLRYYPFICLKKLRQVEKDLSLENQAPDRDLNLGPPECKTGKLTTQTQCLVIM